MLLRRFLAGQCQVHAASGSAVRPSVRSFAGLPSQSRRYSGFVLSGVVDSTASAAAFIMRRRLPTQERSSNSSYLFAAAAAAAAAAEAAALHVAVLAAPL